MLDEDILVIGSSDENYARHLAVAFVSLLMNTTRPERVKLYCIDGGVSKKTRHFMRNAISGLGGSLDFIPIDDALYSELDTIKHITRAAYYRISIPNLVGDTVKKVIYLDCDTIVKGDVADLWGVDLGDHYVAAVENMSAHTYEKSGLAQEDYFNSGVLVLNLQAWRDDDVPSRVIEFKKLYPDRISTNDQCALNGVIEGRWKRLPLKWNQQTGVYRSSDQVDRFPDDEVEQARQMPAIIHYIGEDKPWNQVCFHPFQGEYWRYAEVIGMRPPAGMRLAVLRSSLTSFSRLKKFLRKWARQRSLRNAGVSLYRL